MNQINWTFFVPLVRYYRWFSLSVTAFIVMLIAFIACKKEFDYVAQTQEISQYIKGLNYDPDAMLEVQNINGGLLKTPTDTITDSSLINDDLTVCVEVEYSLQQNAEQVAIIRPTNGIIWPGALVKINKGLLDGMPEPVTLKPAATTLRIDLPGIGEKGTIVVNEPSNSNTQTEIDKALDYWNNNQYIDGYVNASNSSYSAATSFSSEQLALDLGLNVKWASGSVSSQLNYTSSSTSKVAMMTFKQVFYTVTFDTPPQPGDVFDLSVNTGQIKSTFTSAEPPGYVHSVSYGRIIMFRMVTTESASSTEVEGAMKYSTGITSVSADIAAKYKKILENSTIDIVTIGGNADTASQAVTAQNFGDLAPMLTGGNAVYSKSNPGVPIAYTVKFLKDNKVAKMGFTTDYTATECNISRKGIISVKCTGAVTAYFTVTYINYKGIGVSMSSSGISLGNTKTYTIPGGSHDIQVKAGTSCFGSSRWAVTRLFATPQNWCCTIGGTVCFPSYGEPNCDF